ncbi:helix-turn-helix domain-containing protein [Curtobacterium flaccumfaciens]|nr:helix-turn-helix domain-containing protein [Curtobacterium flaccumfaciens]
MITGASLRHARERNGMTQQRLADAVSVSLRTIGNWERSSDSIPRKHWEAVREILPGAEVVVSAPGDLPVSGELSEQFQSDVLDSVNRFMRLREHGYSDQELADMQAKLYQGAVATLDFIEEAMHAGVANTLVREMAAAVTSITIDSGTITIAARWDGFDPFADILYRAARIDAEAGAMDQPERQLYTAKGLGKISVMTRGRKRLRIVTSSVTRHCAYGPPRHRRIRSHRGTVVPSREGGEPDSGAR